jgi:hypothetical protein
MELRQLTIGCAFLVLAALSVSAVEAKTLKFNGTTSSSLLSTEIDSNNDQNKAGLTSGGGKSTLGAFTFQSLTEYAVSGSATCPNGQSGTALSLVSGSGHTVIRFSTGDLLFSRPKSATLCFDPTLARSFLTSGESEIVGGTGKYTNATGSIQLIGGIAQRLFLAPSVSGNRTFNATMTEFSGTVVLP